jgi:hypothetical protein
VLKFKNKFGRLRVKNYFPHEATIPIGPRPAHCEDSRSHSDVPKRVGLLWTSDQHEAQTSTWNQATITTDRLSYTQTWFEPTSPYPWTLKLRPTCCPETSVRNYHYRLCVFPEERLSHLLHGGTWNKTQNLFQRSDLLTKCSIAYQICNCCTSSGMVAGSNPDVVIGIFHWHNPSGRTLAPGSTQPLK